MEWKLEFWAGEFDLRIRSVCVIAGDVGADKVMQEVGLN